MKASFFKKREKDFSIILFSFSAVLASGIFVKLASSIVGASKAGQFVNNVAAKSAAEPNNLDILLKPSRELADQLKQKNVFVPPPPEKTSPVKAVLGILGQEAFIDGQWYKVGDKIGEAEIAAIEPARVKIKWNGNEQYFSPITAEVASDAETGRGGTGRPGGRGGPQSGTSTTVQGQPFGGPGGFGRFGGPGFGNMSVEQMESFRQQREEMRQRFENMSDAEREQFRQQMRDSFGGGGGPGGGNRQRRGGG